MAEQAEPTFIEKIERIRPFAHRPLSSDSDSVADSQKSVSSDNSLTDQAHLDNAADTQAPVTQCYDQGDCGCTTVVGQDETETAGKQNSLPSKSASEENAATQGQFQSLISGQLEEEDMSSASEEDVDNIDVEDPGDIQKPDRTNFIPDTGDANGDTRVKRIFYINDATSRLVAFKSFDEMSQYLMDLKTNQIKTKSSNGDVIKTVLGVSVRSLVNHVTAGEYLHMLHLKNELTDVVIDVRGEKFHAHRVVLCCNSKYFNNLFLESDSNKVPFEVKIRGVSAYAFASFLEFCYTGEIDVHPEIAADLLIMSDHLEVSALKKRCSVIARSLPLQQAVKFMVNCTCKSPHRLYKTLFQRILGNFGTAAKFDDFLGMDVDRLCEFLSSDDLVVQSELEVFQTVIRWIVHNIEGRVKYTMRLMALVRFCYMTPTDIHECAETTGLIRGYDKFREAILIANWQISSYILGRVDPFGFPTPARRACFLTHNQQEMWMFKPAVQAASTPKPKQDTPTYFQTAMFPYDVKIPQAPPIVDILLFGSNVAETSPHTRFVQRYDTRDNQWAHFCKLPDSRTHHAVAAIKSRVFLTGGIENKSPDEELSATNTLFVLDINTKSWRQKTGMQTARRSHCVCTVGGKLYVMGGKDKYNCVLKTVECYDPARDTWKYVCPMNSPRFGAAAARYSGYIMVAGGMGEDRGVLFTLPVLNTVECYDLQTDSWVRRNNLRYPRCNANLVCVKDQLFLCGGSTRSYNYKSSVLVSVSALDEYDEEEDVWNHVGDMVIPRHQAAAAAAGDRLYVIGGVSTVADRVLQSVECFDCREMRWLPGLQDLPQANRYVCCTPMASKWQRPYQDDLDSRT